MFGVFIVVVWEFYESIVNFVYENVMQVYRMKFGVVIIQGVFIDLIVCLMEFFKNLKFQKKSFQVLELLKFIIFIMLKILECLLLEKYNVLVVGVDKI